MLLTKKVAETERKRVRASSEEQARDCSLNFCDFKISKSSKKTNKLNFVFVNHLKKNKRTHSIILKIIRSNIDFVWRLLFFFHKKYKEARNL